MNYSAHYDRLIARARRRVLEGYRERHHVIPRCLGGGNEPQNIVELTAEEHYVAHQLLVKMHPGNPKLVYAASRMTNNSRFLVRNNKLYGWIRKRVSIHAAERQRGKTLSPESIAKRTARQRGIKRTAETRAKMAAALLGKKLSPEHRAAISAAHMGMKYSPTARANMSRSHIGLNRTTEHRANLAAANKGKAPSLACRMAAASTASVEKREATKAANRAAKKGFSAAFEGSGGFQTLLCTQAISADASELP